MTSIAIKPDYELNLMEMCEEARNWLVISMGIAGLVLSRYGDVIWDFTPYIHTANTNAKMMKIDFSSLRFADGSYLINAKHSGILAGMKSYLYVRMTRRNPISGKPLGCKSLVNEFESFRPLLRWMVEEGYNRFSDLTPESCLAFVDHCKTRTVWEHTVGGAKGRKLSKGQLRHLFESVEALWSFKHFLTDALLVHPWPGASPNSLAGVKRYGSKNEVTCEQIPDRLMEKLVQGALRYVVDGYGDDLLDCRDAFKEGQSVKEYFTRLRLKNGKNLTKEITYLRTACYVVIDALSGLRISEMSSLKTGCYCEHEGWDGDTYGWIKGYTYKLEEDPKFAEWMVPPVVKKAVDMLTRLSSPLNVELEKQIHKLEIKLSKSHYLNITNRKKDEESIHQMKKNFKCLFVRKFRGEYGVICGTRMNISLKEFAKHLDLRVESSDLAQVRDKGKIRAGYIWPISPQQFRRTFARYVARCILGDLRYLREHFKHWSLDMTLGYGSEDWLDETLFDEILAERQELQEDIVYGWIDIKNGQKMAGVGGKNIEGARKGNPVLVSPNLNMFAQQISNGFYLRGLGHSYCTEKECKGKGIYSKTECKDCDNRVIDESHIPYWQGVHTQQIELLLTDDCGDPIWQEAGESLRYAEKTLRDLGVEIETYIIPPKPSERRRSCVIPN